MSLKLVHLSLLSLLLPYYLQAGGSLQGGGWASETLSLKLVLELLQPMWRALQTQYDVVEKAIIEASELPDEPQLPWSCMEAGLAPEVG